MSKKIEWVDYELPILYGLDKNERDRSWQIYVCGDTVYKKYGLVGYKITSDQRTYQAKNVKNKLKTTPEQQARRQAKRDWIAQLDKGYHVDENNKEDVLLERKIQKAKEEAGGVNLNVDRLLYDDLNPVATDDKTKKEDKKKSTAKGKTKSVKKEKSATAKVKPMLCASWSSEDKCYKYFDFEQGFYIQPKLDGIRALATIINGQVKFFTRSNKEIKFLDHLRKDVYTFLDGKEDIYLDGEIYAHKLYGNYEYKGKKLILSKGKKELPTDIRFNALTAMARPVRNEPHPLENQACLYVFDIADVSGEENQDIRLKKINTLFRKVEKNSHVKKVETHLVYTEDEIKEYHDHFFENEYEGVIVRSKELYYTSGKRSLYIRKYKNFEDAEFEIVGVELDEGVSREQFTWVCYHPDTDSNFNVKPKGTRELKFEWYDNSDEHIGKLLTVRFQKQPDSEISQQPRFPRGISIRDYE